MGAKTRGFINPALKKRVLATRLFGASDYVNGVYQLGAG
jgi:hypothetical protein